MTRYWPIWIASVVLMIALSFVLYGQRSTPAPTLSPTATTVLQPDDTVKDIGTPNTADAILKIGLIPERDIFAQRKRYRALCDYLEKHLNRSVQLVSANSYQAVLADIEDGQIDAAFLGSLVASLSFDRLGTVPIVKPEVSGGISTYRGVIFVRQNSAIKSIDDLAGCSIAMVKTTTAGDLFPMFLLHERGLYDKVNQPKVAWVGTHDDVVMQVMLGNVDAGAAKNLRLDAMEKAHSGMRVRRLATSNDVPNNALVLRKEVAQKLGPQLAEVLLAMHTDLKGREALALFGAVRFLPCNSLEYSAIYDMAESLGSHWEDTGIDGPAPRRPDGMDR